MVKLLTLLLFSPIFSCAQKVVTTDVGGPSNIYNDALKRYLIISSKNRRPIYDTLFIEKDNITDSLMATISGTKIIVVDSIILEEKLDKTLLLRYTGCFR